MNRLCAIVLLCGTSSVLGLTGRITTREGASFDGEIGIDPKLGWVISEQAGSTNVPFAKLASAQFNLEALSNAVSAASTHGRQLPRGWTNQDIGEVSFSGSAKYEDGLFTLSSAGTRIWAGQPDQFQFLYRSFVGNGQITAQVTNLEAGMGGIIFARSLGSDSPVVFETA